MRSSADTQSGAGSPLIENGQDKAPERPAWTRGIAILDSVDKASWRFLTSFAVVVSATGVAAALMHAYEVAFVAILAPLAVIAFTSARRACVLIALTSPIVGLGAVDLGFHLVPSYPLIATGFAGLVWRRDWTSLHPTKADFLLLAFVLLATAVTLANLGVAPTSTVLNALGANAPGIRPLAQLLALLAMAVVYLVIRVGVRSQEDLATVLRALLVGATFVGMYMVYQVVGRRFGLPFTFVNQRRGVETLPLNLQYIRPNSTLPEASALAQFATIPLFLGVGWIAFEGPLPSWLPRVAPFLIAVAGAVAVVATLSKIGLLACALWLPFLIISVARRSRRRAWMWSVAAIACLLVAVGGVMAARAATQSIGGSGVISNERYVRIGYWIAAVRLSSDHPLGVGVGNFPFYYPEYAPISNKYEYLSELADAHNLFLEATAETGIVGGALFLGFVVVLVTTGLRFADRCRDTYLATTTTALALVFAAGATMHFTYSYFYYPFEWVLAGLVSALPFLSSSAVAPARHHRRKL